MGVPDVLTGLAESVFLADIDHRDREPRRVVATLVGGLIVGIVAATACWVLVLAPYTLIAGRGGEGLAGLGKVAATLADGRLNGPRADLLRSIVATASDGAFFLAFVAMAARIGRHPPRAYATAARGPRWRLLLAGLVLAASALLPLIMIDGLLSPRSPVLPVMDAAPNAESRLAYGLSVLLLVPAAAAEELFFRGWLLRQTAAFTRRPGVLIVAPALLFAVLHLDFTPDAFLARVLMGLGFAYMTLRLGGVEFAIGAHAMNNILIVLLVAPLNPQLSTTSGITANTLLEDAVLVAGYVLITEAVARIAGLRRWAGVKAEEISGQVLRAAPSV